MDSLMDDSMDYDDGNPGVDAMSDKNGMMVDYTDGTELTPFENSILDGLDSTTYNPLASDLPLETTMPESPLSNPGLDENTTPTITPAPDSDSPMKINPTDGSSNVKFGYTCVCCGYSYGNDYK